MYTDIDFSLGLASILKRLLSVPTQRHVQEHATIREPTGLIVSLHDEKDNNEN